MDLFASRLNYKLKPYCAFGLDPYCIHVDCFTIPWNSPYIYYANPPFSMLTKTIQKVQQENSTIMIVFLFWQQQIWLNRLLELPISEIVILPKTSPPFLPWDHSATHPLADNLALCTAIISGDSSKRMDFQQKMPITSLSPNPQDIRNLFRAKLTNGSSFVWHNRLIPITPL